nr:DNA internalization-related competence protein ComEC/Rec2 [Maliibacterium massiliense]
MAALAFFLVCGIGLTYALPRLVWVWIALAALVTLAVLRKKRVAIVYGLAFMLGALGIYAQMAPLRAADALRDGRMQITAQVCSVAQDDVGAPAYYVLDVSQLEQKPARMRMRLYVAGNLDPSLGAGARLEFTGSVKPAGRVDNPGETRAHLLKSGVSANVRADAGEIQVLARGDSAPDVLTRLRAALKARIETLFPPEEGGLFFGMLLGDKEGVTQETYDIFTRGGLLHLLAVSGLHVGYVFVALQLLMRCTPLPILARALLTGVLLFFYAALCGFSPSVVRACVMACCAGIYPLLGRRNDMPSTLALAFAILLLADPANLLDVRFQLSFSAVAGILLLAPVLGGWMHRLPDWLAGTIAVSWAAQVGVLPCTLYWFGGVPLVAFVLNPLLVPVAGVALLLGWAALLLSYIAQPLGWLFAQGCAGLLRCILEATRFATRLDVQLFWPHAGIPLMGVLLFCLLFVLSRYCRLNGRAKRTALCAMGAALMVLGLTSWQAYATRSRTTVLDVGQGQCILVQQGDTNLLFDCGADYGVDASRVVENACAALDIRKIDALFVSHSHSDHAGGVAKLVERVPVRAVYSAQPLEEQAQAACVRAGCAPVTPLAQDTWTFAGNLRVQAFNLNAASGDPNEDAAVFFIRAKHGTMLIMGDVGQETEALLLPELPRADVLVVGHHGAATATGEVLLAKVRSQSAIASCGSPSRYGHPDDAVIAHLQQAGVALYTTYDNGALRVTRAGVQASNAQKGGSALGLSGAP